MSDSPINILGLTSRQFIEAAAQHGVKSPRALEIYRAAMRDGRAIVDWISIDIPAIAHAHDDNGTIKFTQQQQGDLESETVIIPMTGSSGRPRKTLCVSSQIGCAMGCTFCETAQMGLMGNLTPAQFISQWFAARHSLSTTIDNIVFMGMGEPMDNFDSVEHAIRILCDQNGCCIAPSRVTVSTVGRPEGIRRLAALIQEDGFGKVNLAISINAPNDAIRSTLMPINRVHPMSALREAMDVWRGATHRPFMIEYVLIPDVNDKHEHALQLAAYLEGLHCAVNVIPYNPRRDSPWPAPSRESAGAFARWLQEAGLFATLRVTKGRSVMAACGQLGNENIRKRKPVHATVEQVGLKVSPV